MLELQLIKNGGLLYPYLEKDKERMRLVPKNQPFRCTLVRQSKRSVQMNKLYWGGLIKLALDYWEPEAGCVSPNEEAMVSGFAKFLAKEAKIDPAGMTAAKDAYLKKIKSSRTRMYEAPDKDPEHIHKWIKEELGMYELILTPNGWTKVLKSVNFNAMPGQFDYMVFYTGAFNVVWKFLLSRKFESEAEAQNVISQLVAMG